MAQIDNGPEYEANPFGHFAYGLPQCRSDEVTEPVIVMAEYHGR